jgi:hypothetical protein
MPKRRRSAETEGQVQKDQDDNEEAATGGTSDGDTTGGTTTTDAERNNHNNNKYKEDTTQNNNNNRTPVVSAVALPPHVERWIRLATEPCGSSGGTTTHTTNPNDKDDAHTLATAQLTQWTSQQAAMGNDDLVWTVLGQLLSILVKTSSSSSSSWASRQQTAKALQSVATCVPTTDQQSFWQGQVYKNENNDNDDDADDDDITSKYLHQALECAAVNKSRTDNHIDNDHESLLLYATAATVHRQHTEQAEHEYLDTTELSAHERLRAQRRFLAARLGWTHLPITLHHQTLSDLVTKQDFTHQQQEESSPSSIQRPSKKQAIKPSNNLKDTTSSTTTMTSSSSSSSPPSLADWLVRAWQESQHRGGGRSSKTTTAATADLHTTKDEDFHHTSLPQALLAHECLYHMWDTAWQIRHGALLGIMALLKAWQTQVLTVSNNISSTSSSPQYKQEKNTVNTSRVSTCQQQQLGPWPREILGRAVLLLVLDRFGDFAGGNSVHGINEDDRAVVAPVRELSAQLVALVWKAAPNDLQTQCWRTLITMAEQSSVWECQHGALLAIRYIIVLITATDDSSVPPSDTAHSSWYHLCLVQAEATASLCLSSSSLDVAAVGGQILAVLPPSYLKHIQALWEAAPRDVHLCRLVASSHMVPRLAEVLDMTVTAVVYQLQSILLTWISSDMASVRILALQALEDVLRYDYLPSKEDIETVVPPAPHIDGEDGSLYANILHRLFEMHIQLTQEKTILAPEEFSTYEDVQRQLNSTWMSHVRLAQTRLSTVDWTTILPNLIETYFYAPFGMTRPTKYYLLMGPPCAALCTLWQASSFSANLDESDGSWLVSAIHIFLQSPWRVHCELACGLVQYLATVNSLAKGSLKNLYALLSEILECMPLCLQIHKCGAESVLGNEWVLKHRESMHLRLRSPTTKTSLDGFNRDDIQRILREHDLGLGSQKYGVSDFESMRLKAMAASAALALDQPSTITPFVRALMTSMKSDTVEFRLKVTANALTHLLEASHAVNSYSAARTKIIKVLSGIIKQGHADDKVDIASRYASIALGEYLGILSDVVLPDAVKNFEFENAFSTPNATSREEREDALVLFASICKVLVNTPRVTTFFVKRYIQGLCLLSQSDASSSIRDKARRCIRFFCTATSGDDIGFAFPFAARLIDKEEKVDDILRSCLLLKDLCEVSPAVLARYVRLLLPRILKSMTHSDRRVAETASAIFSVLVRVAPLVDKFASGKQEQSDDVHTASVIDHLIQGKPLPRTKLPSTVDDALQLANVELRDYQHEGISWIHFLMSVNLNGALVSCLVKIERRIIESDSPNLSIFVVCFISATPWVWGRLYRH